MEKLQNCLIRFLCWTNEYKNADISELNDLENIKEDLVRELKIHLGGLEK